MNWTEHARSLIAYNRWANEKVLGAAVAGDPASTTRDWAATTACGAP